jgi:hypothetical protein
LRERRVGAALANLPPDERAACAAEGAALGLDEALDRATGSLLAERSNTDSS